MPNDDVTDAGVKPDNSGAPAPDAAPAAETEAAPEGNDTAPASAPETLLNAEAPAEEPKAVAPADWPEDWRTKLSKDDEKLGKRLERFKSPGDIVKSWLSAEQKISSGEFKAELPKDATEEQITEYRNANGIPQEPTGYLDSLGDGLVVGEEDKEKFGSFLETAHAANMPPAYVNAALAWYNEEQEATATAVIESDKQYARESEDSLRAEWGPEYRANVNTVKSFLDTAPVAEDGTSFTDLLMGARLADGTAFGSNPAALKWILGMAGEINPAGFISPGEAKTQAQGVEDEINKINEIMRTDRKKYDKDPAMQARYLQLLDAQEKLSARA